MTLCTAELERGAAETGEGAGEGEEESPPLTLALLCDKEAEEEEAEAEDVRCRQSVAALRAAEDDCRECIFRSIRFVRDEDFACYL